MTNTQRAKLDSYNRLANFNTKYATPLAPLPEYLIEQTAFNNAAAIINAASGVQVQTTVAPVTTNNLKQAMAETTFIMMLRAMVKAKQAGNIALANQLDEPISFITGATKTEAILRAKNMRNLINDNLAIFTNISSTDITNIDAAIAAYDSVKDQQVEAIQTKKASGTDLLPNAFKAADEAVSNMYSLVRSYFEAADIAMVNEMKLAIEIINTGLRHTDVAFTILSDNDGTAIKAAIVTDTSNGKTYSSDENGVATISKHRNGHFNFSIAAAGRQLFSLGVDIVQGMHNAFTVRLKEV